MGTGAKGTISNPYTMAEFEELADAGLWQGGFVIDDGGNVTYTMAELTVTGYSGYSGDGSDGSDYDPWGSDPWGSDPWGSDPNGSDDYPWNGDDGTGGTGGTGGTPGGGTSGGGGGGHHGGGTNGNTEADSGEYNSVPDVSNKVTFSGLQKNDLAGCLRRCEEMLKSAGAELTGGDIPMGIYQDKHVIGPVENYSDGVLYIEEQLYNGYPVIVYVDYKDGCSVGSTKNDKAGDHAIIIVGGSRACGFHFYDPATRYEERGTSANNLLIFQNGMLQCDCTCTGHSKHYILSSIRINK